MLQEVPSWALLLGLLGRSLIVGSVVSFLLSALSWFVAPKRPRLSRVGIALFWAGSLCLFGAFLSLGTLLLLDQFGFRYVFQHSDRSTEIAYKIAGLWAGQEGSFLLWGVCAAVLGLAAAPATRSHRREFSIPYALFLAALAAIQVYESPFEVQLIDGRNLLPPDGNGLNPALLNYWMVIHPPTIFLGFGSLTVLFAWSVAALWRRDLDGWSAPVRGWAILSATLLGIGLCMGGFWAYETLGWGGFWAWDPVENTSFVPWVWSVALIHGLFIQAAKGRWKWANTFLAGTSLLTFVYGTFLTRSGFLKDTSVHSFAEMDRSALWVLVGVFALSTMAFLGLWIQRAWSSRFDLLPDSSARETPERGFLRLDVAYSAGVWLLIGLGTAAAIGMSVPLMMALLGRPPKVVEEALYHKVLVWAFVPTMLLIGVAPHLGWRGCSVREALRRLGSTVAVSLFLLGLVMIVLQSVPTRFKPEPDATLTLPWGSPLPLVPALLFLVWCCLFAASGNLVRATLYWRKARWSLGGVLTHLGVAISMLGLIASRGLERKDRIAVQEGQPGRALGYEVSLAGRPSNYLKRDNEVPFRFDGPHGSFVARPVLYYTESRDGEPKPTVRPFVASRGWYDLYVALGPMVFEVGEPVTLKPGETVEVEQTRFTFGSIRRTGEPGADGTVFEALISYPTAQGTATAAPSIQIGSGGPLFRTAEAGPYRVSLQRMNAADNSVTLQFFFKTPLFPLEVFYKPLTLLVWVGAGIMTAGGLLAAWSRKRSNDRRRREAAPTDPPAARPVESDLDAPVTVPQS